MWSLRLLVSPMNAPWLAVHGPWEQPWTQVTVATAAAQLCPELLTQGQLSDAKSEEGAEPTRPRGPIVASPLMSCVTGQLNLTVPQLPHL